MPRPTKSRRVCRYPETLLFSPPGGEAGEAVVLSVDEFEVIRLMDKVCLSQEEAGRQMGVARIRTAKIRQYSGTGPRATPTSRRTVPSYITKMYWEHRSLQSRISDIWPIISSTRRECI